MTITQLQYTISVAKHGNFTIAAQKCFVTQPTLSMQVQKLEEELGIKLFDRSTKPIRLTSVGSKIINQASVIIKEVQRMEDVVSLEKGFIGGDFKLGIIPTIMPTLLPLFLQFFIKQYPKVNLKIEELNTDNIIKLLLDGELDAGIAATPLSIDKIKEKPLYYEPFVGYVPKNNSLSKNTTLKTEDLENSSILVLEDGHCFRHHTLNLCKTKKKTNDHFDLKSGSFETLVHLANKGLGMTLLPYLHTLQLTPENKLNLRSFENPEPAREISLIYSETQLKNSVINVLSKTIESILRNFIQLKEMKIISPKPQH
jgi:LysR family hydrogen peroxide-inducible transcriptional activator